MLLKRICAGITLLSTLISLLSCAGDQKRPDSYSSESDPPATTEFNYVPSGEFKYDTELAPMWLGNTVYDETVMFVGIDDKAPLLYNATSIVSVTSFDGKTTYVYGKDYTYTDGKLCLLPGTSIKYMPLDQYYGGDYDLITKYNGVSTPTFWGGGAAMANYQVKVTYTHNDTSTVSIPDCSESFADVISKLENGEDVTVFFYGDSITNGWDSSQRGNFAPYMPAWPALFTQYLAYAYGYKIEYVATLTRLQGTVNYPKVSDTYGDRGTITYINTAVSGWTVDDGYKNREKYVKDLTDEYGCDIFFFAFGMNDGFTNAFDFGDAVYLTVKKLREFIPDTSFVLVSPMLPNNENVNKNGNIKKFEDTLKSAAALLKKDGAVCEVAPVTSVCKRLCEVKRFRDHSGNNMNHPGDYTHRIYAQVALQTVLGYAEKYTDSLPAVSTPEGTTTPAGTTTPESTTTPEAATTTKPVTTTPEETTMPETTAPAPDVSYTPSEPYKYENELVPIWEGNTVYKEYVMFLGKNDEVPLLYPATEILSVTSADGTKTFTEGVDYELKDGKLVMPKGSGMLYIPEDVYWPTTDPYGYGVMTGKDGVATLTYSGPGDTMSRYQVAVTYKHNATPTISVPDCSDKFASVIEKMEKGEDVTFIFYGDSITNGYESTLRFCGSGNRPYTALVTEYLAHRYGYKINYVNTGLTSTYTYPDSQKVSFGDRGTINYINVGISGLGAGQKYVDKQLGSTDCGQILQTYVLDLADTYGLDIFFFAFGMNDGWYPATTVSNQANSVIRTVLGKYSDAAVVVVSSMIPNNEVISSNPNNVPYQEAELVKVVNTLVGEGKNVALAPMQSVHKAICAVKRYRDHSGNNMNHPGDYTHRVYAQVILQTITGYADN